ncbi:aspartate carbamoyltransferase [Porticoccaceae bacterium]|nr:aspartate carbamoyltransferase [Porticoccaceae bacterium]MCT2531701.1 aspartate carbamoyltransferase [SAR92 clade bacterium H231]MBT7904469.1 aspartate carbamoyltransferase [Porticoccaceae bacterium]MDA7816247.1 aspartate carbamoyltransferase [Porticoccaceae bacterium]MDA7853431.1 aspartate carbamoyltransferase [Porticoccaceae bacterium]
MNFTGAHILSINQFQRQDVERVFAVADQMQPYALRKKVTRVLEGAILGNMFFEASTRTRVSFGSAFNLLGGEVRETAGFESSALVKGESLQDTARVLSGFSDVICMRHPQEGSVADFASASRVPVMNGGDGANEHPTQALLDLYTIRSELEARGRAIDGLKIAMIGDLRHGRTVHSLSKLLSVYNNIEVVLVSPRELCLPAPIIEAMRSAGVLVKESHELTGGISDVDIVYSTRIQEERFSSKEEADLYRGKFRLNQAIYTEFCQPNTVIMHPLPRDSRADANELDSDLDSNPNLAIFRQTDNGVLVRMALFALVLDVAHLVDDYACDVRWYNSRQS